MTRHELLSHVEGNAPGVGFAHAVVPADGQTVYLAGQTALGPDGEIAGVGVVEQLDVAAGNLVRALAAADGAPADLVWLQLFVTDVPAYKDALGELGSVWQRNFGRHYPAMALVGVQQLFDEAALVEISGVAVVPAR